ncbi:class I SAM-dependent methyltransferase [Nostoc spongiaeforme FACHB-130]|uniref:Class I SAM-dependent methyltransferase n=1 Tax=Nostoc spongiaeforme FACHB-130 TaxID=1357510 RepID=A0ABR8FYL4_9NOSO|nr:class I SAM-dependent methyltransferase [Nostoc spongiaeforme]MBD2596483.1 class I SAM-dependent methyltransferase [Nostoc spongiaeforme FACHB-130]
MMSCLQQAIACPVCQKTLTTAPPDCKQCQNYFRQEVTKIPLSLVDLTPAQVKGKVDVVDSQPLRTELFRLPIISFLYERILPPIWAMGLRNRGGIDTEFQQCIEFFGQNLGTVADISCGTGIFARRLALLQQCQQIIALDYSETMLGQLQQQMQRDGVLPSQIAIIRGDITALPFAPNSLDAVYSGAAMHCWPDATAGIRNIYQALGSGGKLFATTFLQPLPSIVFRFFTADELQQIAIAAGFHPDCVQLETRGVYGTLKCIK